MDNYDDIINLPHHVSKRHPQMSMWNRAAQFAPFAALTGYEESIKESEQESPIPSIHVVPSPSQLFQQLA